MGHPSVRDLAHTDLSEAFGRILRTHRVAAGLSQDELAYQAGLTRNYVSLLERGQRNPTLNTMFALASALDTTLQALLSELDKL